tara:strand:+ start:2354 stop:3733 length:1380 start_codon:yes stop_codon:yes gene_type:complete
MMNNSSPKLDLPFIQPAQAQKHVTHNEAIKRLDVLVQAVVEDAALTSPPAGATEGDSYIVAPGGINAWEARDGEIATFYNNSWDFITPQKGWSVYVKNTDGPVTYTGATWVDGSQILRPSQLGVSAEPDDTNRLSVSSDATLFNHNGAGHQLKLNKAGSADTASLLFQNGFAGRAEMGISGNDSWSLKVSPDGSTWREAIQVDPVLNTISLSPMNSPRLLLGDASAEINVPVTGTAVQASPTDPRSERLLKGGAFGLGNSVQLDGAQNLKDRNLKPGFYNYIASAVTDGPESAAWLHTLIVTQVSSWDERRSFISLRTTSSTPRMWFGSQSSNTGDIVWSRILINDHITGTVSQNMGKPTGAIIERGINANGQYTRWADGTQTCFGRKANASTNPETIIFPASFVNGSVPVCTLTAERNNNGDHPLVTLRTVTASNMTTQSNAFPALHNVHWTATGRWF